MWDEVRRRLFPAACTGCGSIGTLLCASCGPQLHERLAFTLEDGLPVRALGAYDGPLRAAILALKAGERAAIDALAPLLAQLMGEPAHGIAVVPASTTWWRANRRGFDQGIALARAAAAVHGIPVVTALRRRGVAQHGAGRARRIAVAGRYVARGAPSEAIVLDDVCTTGATLRDAAAALDDAGCIVHGAIVVARTPEGRAGRTASIMACRTDAAVEPPGPRAGSHGMS